MPIFVRNVNVEALEEGPNLRLQGRLEDRRAGEFLHVMEVDMLFALADATILDIRGSMPQVPLPDCRLALETLEQLVGERMVPGFSDFVRTTIGGPQGCSHLAALITNMGNTSVQGRGAVVRKLAPTDEIAIEIYRSQASQLNLAGSCISWREGGPLASRFKRSEEPNITISPAGIRYREMEFKAKAPICLNCVHFHRGTGCSEGLCTLKGDQVKEYNKACEEFELFT